MKHALLVLSCVALTFACSDDSGSDDSGNDGTETTASGDGDGDAGDGDGDSADTTDADTGNEPVATVSGTIVDMMGAPLPSPLLQMCGPIDEMGNVELCIPEDVDPATGAFEAPVNFVGLWSIKVVQGPVDDRNFTGQAFQVTLNEGDDIDLGEPVIVPEADAVTMLEGETTVDIDGVLAVTIDPTKAQSPDFLAPTMLGGLAAPQDSWRVTEVEGSPVIAAWSFSPFGIKSTEGGFGFTIADGLGLDPDTAVVFWEIEKDNGALHEIATGTVNPDASAIDVVPTGEGLHELTWLLVTEA